MPPAAVEVLEVAPAAWAELVERDPNATAAHRPPLWEAIAAVLPRTRVRLLLAREPGRVIGGGPVALEGVAGLSRLHAMPWVLPGAPLALPGRHAEVDAGFAEGLAQLAARARAVSGEWSLYRPHGPAPAREAIERLPGETTWLETAVLDLADGGEAAWQRVVPRTRADLRHARAAGLAFAEEPGALDAAWALYAAQSRGWAGHRPLPLELSRRLLRGAPAVGRLFTVREGGGLLSAGFVLDHARETLVWWSGTHPVGRTRHAFPFLLWSIAEWARGAGRERVNLGASPGLERVAGFKRSLGARAIPYPVRWLRPAPRGWPARLAAWAQGRAQRGRARGAPE